MTNSRLKTQDSTLLIISHTEHYKNGAGEIVGWVPTIREIDFLASHFKKVIHLAVLEDVKAPNSAIAYSAKNVEFLSIPAFGGAGIGNKLKIITVLPKLLGQLKKAMRHADVFQFRAPTSIGVFLIPVLTLFYRKQGWYKYAGNWMQEKKPVSYALQKWMLEKWQKRPVTVNGNWPGQKDHVFTFENPSLSAHELAGFKRLGEKKDMMKPLTGCFVGRLEDPKGVARIITWLKQPNINQVMSDFHFVGDGDKRAFYEEETKGCEVNIHFHGFASRDETFGVFENSDLFFLPSTASEGFPKVIAEAAAFGCVPVVSNVSSIGQYINMENGYVWDLKANIDFNTFMQQIKLDNTSLKKKQEHIFSVAELFTFEAYLEKLKKHIFTA